MKGQKVVEDYLRDMIEAMDKATLFISDHDLLSFKEDEKCSYAVIRCLEILGEAAKKIPASLRRKYGKIPWKSLAGMRDKLIHDYAGVDLEVVYRTVKDDIPSIRNILVGAIDKLDD